MHETGKPMRGRISTFKLDRSGLARMFGELEAAVMEAVWRLGQASVNDVCADIGPEANYKTVMTVMNRLVEKGALRRARRARAYVYSAAETREDLVARVSRRVVEGLARDFGDVAIAQFVSSLDAVDPSLVAKLGDMIERHSRRGLPCQGGDIETGAQRRDPSRDGKDRLAGGDAEVDA